MDAKHQPLRTRGFAQIGSQAWLAFVAEQAGSWFSHFPEWCALVDTDGSGRDHNFAVVNAQEEIVAVVPCVADAGGSVVVSGVVEPAGPLLRASLPAQQRRLVWDAIDSELTAIGAQTSAKFVGLKFPVLTHSGTQPMTVDDQENLDRLGYSRDVRLFNCMDLTRPLEEIRRNVSSRIRSQIRAAERQCVVREVTTEEDLEALLDVYWRHAKSKHIAEPLSRECLEQLLMQDTHVTTLATIGIENDQPQGYSISVGVGPCATLYAWGCAPQKEPSQMSKLLVWSSFEMLRERGFATVEYGGAISDDARFSGLTEFYRRFGGVQWETTWAYRRLRHG
ncbi:GNAT family N-acetyltransferase [Natronoglycomyces albus]|uniref:GNAT family N-acetyltransferase n=1 Tax=Natronoglycomyces albus TaxID=2811108 RepID=A0A895XKK5_9ACTN|nr:GNAT family N-acetyltransferase [Natronoglycomyces albus]QSB04342.1 GNAT family N-acetyltransferase [Natronoglycomyces albus]